MKVQVKRAIFIGGEAQPIGTIIDIERPLAVELVAMGKVEAYAEAEVVAEPEVEAPKAKRAKKGGDE